jgi:hypothetical protein
MHGIPRSGRQSAPSRPPFHPVMTSTVSANGKNPAGSGSVGLLQSLSAACGSLSP